MEILTPGPRSGLPKIVIRAEAARFSWLSRHSPLAACGSQELSGSALVCSSGGLIAVMPVFRIRFYLSWTVIFLGTVVTVTVPEWRQAGCAPGHARKSLSRGNDSSVDDIEAELLERVVGLDKDGRRNFVEPVAVVYVYFHPRFVYTAMRDERLRLLDRLDFRQQ